MKTDARDAQRAVASPVRRRPRSLAHDMVDDLGRRIREGGLAPGDKLPSEGRLMDAFGVSRTVVREALSKLQAAGMVHTRHGVGTFVVGTGQDPGFRIAAHQLETLRDVVALLELRIGVETEAASLAAQRRTADNLAAMREALDAFARAVEEGRDAVEPDFRFHAEIARSTQNAHFENLMTTLGARIIPRSRLEPALAADPGQRDYLRRVNVEHESLFDAIERQDPDAARAAMRTHLSNSRERRRQAFGT